VTGSETAPDERDAVVVEGTTVHGVGVDGATRCRHYGGERDVVAVRFRCCDRYHPCHACHDALAAHAPSVWPRSAFDRPAVLCGLCGAELTVHEYLRAEPVCPACGAAFNPGCRRHHHRYFDLPAP
jgi:uncharacterized CHY-type Zn-finger protein